MTIFESVVLGIVEGLSEFLPISSTGHLILASALLKLQQTEAHKAFEVTIQSGAILAVVYLYRERLVARGDLFLKLCVGFLPTGILGFTLYKAVKSLFVPSVTSYMLIAGGLAFIVIERHLAKGRARGREQREVASGQEAQEPQEVTYRQSLIIGTVQSLSMVPGVSRSGATILGGLLVGLERKAAAEFSFLLAIPTMFAATAYDIYKNLGVILLGDWQHILVGFVTSFVFAVIGIKFLLNYLTSHTFIPFGVYRIVVGLLSLYLIS